MNQIEFDALRDQNWSGIYAEVPQSVNEGVQMAFSRIRARERRRRHVMRFAACAACLCLVVGAVTLTMGREKDAPDRVAAPVAQLPVLTEESIVFASLNDPCFHIHEACPAVTEEVVELQLMTALEFEKTACEVCGAKAQLPQG